MDPTITLSSVGLTSQLIALAAVTKMAESYPEAIRVRARESIDRMAFNIGLLPMNGTPLRVCDLGGGTSLFSPALAAMGHAAYLVDDFDDPVNHELGLGVLDQVHRPAGVNIIAADLLSFDLRTIAPLDAVTSFDSIEHWHRSPRATFQLAIGALRPGGTFLLSAPNAANARKRIAVPLGKSVWSLIEEWYDKPTFREHVREPVVADLRHIARDLKLADVRIFGRNWLGYINHSRLGRLVTPFVDHALRLRASLCSDIYLLGRKAVH